MAPRKMLLITRDPTEAMFTQERQSFNLKFVKPWVINHDTLTTRRVHTGLKQQLIIILNYSVQAGQAVISTTCWCNLEVNSVHTAHKFELGPNKHLKIVVCNFKLTFSFVSTSVSAQSPTAKDTL